MKKNGSLWSENEKHKIRKSTSITLKITKSNIEISEGKYNNKQIRCWYANDEKKLGSVLLLNQNRKKIKTLKTEQKVLY